MQATTEATSTDDGEPDPENNDNGNGDGGGNGGGNGVEGEERSPQEQEVRAAVRFLYDLQRVRIQTGGRHLQEAAGKQVDLEPGQVGFMKGLSVNLEQLEKDAEKHVEALCKGHAVNGWLRDVKGVGARMAGVIISEVDIRKAPTVSALWRYCGLAVIDGEAERRRKGEKLSYNHWLKTKILGVLGPSFLKCQSPYAEHYYNRKNRKESEGWGESDGHRHNDALRIMVKEFLKDLWMEWRQAEGLETRPPYKEEYLGKTHQENPHRSDADDGDE